MSAKKRKHNHRPKPTNRGKDSSASESESARVERRRISLTKKLLFALIPVALLLGLAEFVLWAAGTQPRLAEEDPFVGFSSQVPLLTERSSGDETVMVTADNKIRWFNRQEFPKEKREDTVRIVSLGGSTTYGRPYDDQTSFSGWLRVLLPAADSTKRWEVVNAGGISYASYRAVRVMEELSRFKPDVFIVYTGHNEFLEERTYRDLKQQASWITTATNWVGRTRIYSVLHRLVHSRDTLPTDDGEADESQTTETGVQLAEEVRTRLDRGVGPDAYQRDDPLAEQIAHHFRFNLNRMVDIAQQSNAKLILVTPASNLGDCSPFKSQLAAAGEDAQAVHQSLVDKAQSAIAEQDDASAERYLNEAIELDAREAATQYELGRVLLRLGRHAEARAAFLTARDEDVCPLRATSSLVQIVRDVAIERDVALVDFVALVEEKSKYGIPNESLFLDHVHPSIEGNQLLALELMQRLVDMRVVTPSKAWNQEAVERVANDLKQKIDRRAHGEALRNLAKVLTWAGKNEEANRAALRAEQMNSGDAETYYLAGNALLSQGKVSDAIEKLKQALEIDSKHVQAWNSLGAAYYKAKRRDEAIATWKRVAQLDPTFAAVHNNLGSAYQGNRDYDNAIVHFKEAIRINPRYASAFNNLGVMLRNQDRLDEANATLKKAIGIDPRFAEAHYNLGTVLAKQGKSSQGLEEFKACLRLNPEYAPAHHQIAILLQQQGQQREAVEALKQALRGRSVPIDVPRRLAWILSTSRDDALRDGKVAMRLVGQVGRAVKQPNVELLRTLAAANAEIGKFTAAVKWQEQAIRLADGDDEIPKLKQQLDQLRQHMPIRE